MILRKKPKRTNIQFDEDSNEESSYSNFSQRYLGKDEESVVEVDSDVDFRKNKYDLDKKLITKTKEKFIDLEGNDINYIDDDEENKIKNVYNIIKLDEKDDIQNKKFRSRRMLELENDIKMRELIKKSSNQVDVVQLFGDENYDLQNNNTKQKDFIKIIDFVDNIKPKKNIISLDEENEIIDLEEDNDKKEIKNKPNKVFVFK